MADHAPPFGAASYDARRACCDSQRRLRVVSNLGPDGRAFLHGLTNGLLSLLNGPPLCTNQGICGARWCAWGAAKCARSRRGGVSKDEGSLSLGSCARSVPSGLARQTDEDARGQCVGCALHGGPLHPSHGLFL